MQERRDPSEGVALANDQKPRPQSRSKDAMCLRERWVGAKYHHVQISNPEICVTVWVTHHGWPLTQR